MRSLDNIYESLRMFTNQLPSAPDTCKWKYPRDIGYNIVSTHKDHSYSIDLYVAFI